MKLVGKSQREIRSTSTAFSLLFFIRSRISFCFFAWASCNNGLPASLSKNLHSNYSTNNKNILADFLSDYITRNSFCCGFSGKNFPLPELCLCWFQEIEPQQDSWLACWGQRGREEEEEVVERDLHLLHLGHGCGCLYEW